MILLENVGYPLGMIHWIMTGTSLYINRWTCVSTTTLHALWMTAWVWRSWPSILCALGCAGNGRHRLFVRTWSRGGLWSFRHLLWSNELMVCCSECVCHDDREEVVALTFCPTVFLLDFGMFMNAQTAVGRWSVTLICISGHFTK